MRRSRVGDYFDLWCSSVQIVRHNAEMTKRQPECRSEALETSPASIVNNVDRFCLLSASQGNWMERRALSEALTTNGIA